MNRGSCLVFLCACAASAQNHQTWSDYGGAPDSAEYSSLKQINRSNVNQLQIAWTYQTGDNRYAFNPLMVDGTTCLRRVKLGKLRPFSPPPPVCQKTFPANH